MISAYNLLWIVPISMMIGAVLLAFVVINRSDL